MRPASVLLVACLSAPVTLAPGSGFGQTVPKPPVAAQSPVAPVEAASLLTAGDGTALAALLLSQGYRAQMETADDGSPRLRSSSDGINFTIAFLGCEGGDCRAIMFTSSFRMDSPPTVEAINDWNRTRNVGTAYLAGNGQPGLIFFIPMEGGISLTAFDYAFESWRVALADYAREIRFR
jgi:hypothetical protein